jgi:electron transfer flavoprotein beta subunit
MAMNPFDEIAVEEAVRLKEKKLCDEITAISIGSAKSEETLRTALAIGVDKGILVETEEEVQPLEVAKILKEVVKKNNPDLVLMGKQAIDDDSNQTGQMLAALLGWPQGTFASKLEINGKKINVTREIDGGLETLGMELPAIITTDLRLNEPRYASLPNIMKAKQKPVEKITPNDLNVEIKQRLKTLKVTEPPKKTPGIKVDSVQELISKLHEVEKVI